MVTTKHEELVLMDDTKYLRELRRTINDHFNSDELKLVCADLGVEWGELSGDTFSLKINALVGYMGRRGKLKDLIGLLKEERPNSSFSWPDLPSPDKQEHDVASLILIVPSHEIERTFISEAICLRCNDLIRVNVPAKPDSTYNLIDHICPHCELRFHIKRFASGHWEIYSYYLND